MRVCVCTCRQTFIYIKSLLKFRKLTGYKILINLKPYSDFVSVMSPLELLSGPGSQITFRHFRCCSDSLVLGTEPRVVHMLTTCYTFELTTSVFAFVLDGVGLSRCSKQASSLRFSHSSLPNTGTTRHSALHFPATTSPIYCVCHPVEDNLAELILSLNLVGPGVGVRCQTWWQTLSPTEASAGPLSSLP